ncbi:MAG: ESPR-type extended signal peptide-containing protein [Megasphaera elsdenii]|uniref:ESPR-type extended signal peptide-containing protein n=1 Tax=Megasphaera elsdenii TaxID=907 RepID=UPI003F11A397
MNKIFKVIYSKTRHCYVVVSELAKNQGKSEKSKYGMKRHNRFYRLAAIAALIISTGSLLYPMQAEAATDLSTNDYFTAYDKNYFDKDGNKSDDWKNGRKTNTDQDSERVGAKGTGAIAAGLYAQAGQQTVTIGNRNAGASMGSVYVGEYKNYNTPTSTSVLGGLGNNYVTSVGFMSNATKYGTVAIGANASAEGEVNDIKFGETDESGTYTHSLPENPNIKGASVALGYSAKATAGNIAIGAYSDTTTTTSATETAYTKQKVANSYVSIGNSTTQRRITNVADGADATDVATVGQLQALSKELGGYKAGFGIQIDPDSTDKTKNTISLNRNLGTNYTDKAHQGDEKVTVAVDDTGLVLGGYAEDEKGNKKNPAVTYGATGDDSVTVGGMNGLASGKGSVVAGGMDNIASGVNATVVGGDNNDAIGNRSSVFGGRDNTAAGIASTASGGIMNAAVGQQATAIGGSNNYVLGANATAVGGLGRDYANGEVVYDSAVRGGYSVGIAGGSTGENAIGALAAGHRAVVTTENGTAIGYQATTDEAGTIAFGHDKGDVSGYTIEWNKLPEDQVNADGTTNDYTKAPKSIKKNEPYTSAYYNRLVKVADGEDDHDVVVMEQLKQYAKKDASNIGNNLTVTPVYQTDDQGNIKLGSDNKPLIDKEKTEQKRKDDQTTNKNVWGAAIGTGSIADPTKSEKNDPAKNGSQQLVTGGTVYNALQQQKTDLTNDLSVNAGWGINVADEKDPKTGEVTKKNVISLNRNLGTNYGNTYDGEIYGGKGKVTFEADGENSLILGGGAINNSFEGKDKDFSYGAHAKDSVLVGGMNNSIEKQSEGAIIVGGTYNTASSANQVQYTGKNTIIVGGMRNKAEGNGALLIGGSDNQALSTGEVQQTGEDTIIIGGSSNKAEGDGSVLIGGSNNESLGLNTTTIGGWNNKNEGWISSIWGGTDNQITGIAQAAGIFGGNENKISNAGSFASILGGKNNTVENAFGVVVGGTNNIASGAGSSVIGGEYNAATNAGDVISGGFGNLTSGDHAYAAGGTQNYVTGMAASSLGGKYSSVNGMFSTGVAGGSTGKDAMFSLAAGYQSLVADSGIEKTDLSEDNPEDADELNKYSEALEAYGEGDKSKMESLSGYYKLDPDSSMGHAKVTHYDKFSTALGYQATANKPGTIAFGHDAGDESGYTYEWEQLPDGQVNLIDDTTNDYTKAPKSVKKKAPYTSAYYNRLVKVADGIDDHDVVVMEQLKQYAEKDASNIGNNIKVYKTDENQKPVEDTDATKTAQKTSKDAWGKALGAEKFSEGSTTAATNASTSDQLVTGKTLYDYGKPTGSQHYVKANNTTGQNLSALDAQVKANADELNKPNRNIKYYSVKTLPLTVKGYTNENNDGAKGKGSLAAGFVTHADGIASTVAGSYSGVINSGNVQGRDLRGAAALSYGTFNVNQNTDTAKEHSGVANSIVGQANMTTNSNAAIIYGAGNTVTDSYRPIKDKAKAILGSVSDPTKLSKAMQDAVKESGGQVMVMGGGNSVDNAYMTQIVGVGNNVKGTNTNKNKKIASEYDSSASTQYNYVDGFQNTLTNGKNDYIIGSNNSVTGDSIDKNQSNIIFGDNHKLAGQKNNVIIGSSDTADDETTASDVVAIGHNAKVSAEGGVAIGSGSVAAAPTEKVSGYDPTTKIQSADKTSHVWNATTGAVSIGTSDGTVTRQINGVAAGTNDTDAVNVAQLKKLGDNTVQYDLNTQKGKITLAGQDGTTITNVKSALDGAKDAEGKDVTIATATGDALKNAANLGDLQKVYNDINTKAENASASHTALTVEGGTSAGTKDEKTKEDVYAGKNILLHESTDENGKVTYDLKLAKDINIGKPGKNGEDGKIGIDGRDGHIGLNGSDGITVRGLDGENGTPGKDGVTITGPKGADGTDGKVGISGKNGKDAVSISGKNGVGHIGLTGPAGTNGKDGTNAIDITVKNGYDEAGKDGKDGINGQKGVDGTSLTRIVYEDKNGKHQVATLEDGLKFKGDGGTVIAKKLNNTMEIIGGADSTKLTDKNIGVNSDGDKLKVQLSKDLTGMNSTTYTTTTGEGESATTSTTVVNGNGLTITDGPSITNKGIDGGNKVITNVGSGIKPDANGKYTVTNQNKGNAANIGDVQNIVKDAKDELISGDNGLNNKANIDASNIGANLKNADGSVASAEDQKANAEKWGSAIGTGEIKADDGRMVTGKTVYDEVRPTQDGNYVKTNQTTGANLSALDSKIGKLDETKTYNYIDSKASTTISDNLTKLDTQVKDNADAITNINQSISTLNQNAVKYDDSNKSKITLGGGEGSTTITNVKDGALSDSSTDAVNGKQLYNEQKAREAADKTITEKVTKNTNEITKIKNGEGFTDTGKIIIKNLSKDAVQVKAGDRIKVDEATDEKTGNKTYTISANNNGTVEKGDGNLISGGTLYNEVHVTTNGSYIKGSQTVGQNLSALDTGLKTTSDLIHTNTKGDTIQIGGNSTAMKIDVNGKDGKGRVITGVVSDANDPNSAANVGYVNGLTAANTQQIYRDMNNAYSRLDTNINRAAAGSNALAALHPLYFDPADKASFAVGYGHYRNANAAAVGAFYQPNANTMVNMGISLGNGDPGFNAGVSFKIGKGSAYNGVSKAEMAQTIHDQATEISAIKANDAAKDKRIDALEKENQEMKKQIQEILARLNG